MARFNASDVQHYGGQGGGGFLPLKDDGDKATVRFLYRDVEDIQCDTVHQVMVDGRKKYIDCLRTSYKSPVDECPFCREKKPQLVKLFVPCYNVDEDKVQIWERGKSFPSVLTGLCTRYATDTDFVAQVFDIERHGKKNDQNTTYGIYAVGQPDDTLIEDFQLPDIKGYAKGLVLTKSADDMEYYLQEGEFPPVDDEDDVEEEPVRRRTPDRGRDRNREEAPSNGRRRTPASRNRNTDEDVY